MARGCGAWDDIEENWDLFRFYAMRRYWRTVALPLDVAMSIFVGWKPPRVVNGESAKGDLGELVAMFSDSGGMIN